MSVHRQVRLTSGHVPGPGEMLVGARAHQSLGLSNALTIGDELWFEDRVYRVSGTFIAPGTVLEAELWLARSELMAATQRQTLSAVYLRLPPGVSTGAVELFAASRLDLSIVAVSAQEYYNDMTAFFAPLRWMAWITAVLIAVAALMGGMNSWYAAITNRSRELAMLQAVGFRRWMIAWSLLQESIVISLLGGLMGLLAAMFLLDGLAIDLAGGVFVCQLGPSELYMGIIAVALVGLCGWALPSWRCFTMPLATSLRS